jgi:hypothetical protein
MSSQIQRVEKQAVLFTKHRPDDLSHTKSPCVPEPASGASTVSWLMKIPIELESSTDFTARVAVLVAREDAIVYVDTSFLMWLTKIGRTSRRQLMDWLVANCPDRVYVPVWSAHEYLRHHMAETIVTELTQRAKSLDKIASKTYNYLRPFLDDILVPGTVNAETQQVDARAALNELQVLAKTVQKWTKEHKEHAAEVITFINDHVLEKTHVFEYMSYIETLSKGRFNGRIPPGFQDRGKKAQVIVSTDEDENAGTQLGSNHWGDLIFWKEILSHATEMSAAAIIILTNDRKNDWYLKSSNKHSIDVDLLKLKSSWESVPCVHPMLNLEARVEANVNDIVLLDAPYLGALLRSMVGEPAKNFVDVAIVPDPPRTPGKSNRSRAVVNEVLKPDDLIDAEDASAEDVAVQDEPQTPIDTNTFARALFDSREAPEAGGPVDALLQDIKVAMEGRESVTNLLTEERIEPLDNSMLTTMARELHDRCLARTPGYDEAITDVVSMLDKLPELTAASIYLGLIASMYLERETNEARLPPSSPIASFLFATQDANYAVQPINTLRKKFETLNRWPLYILDVARPKVKAILDIVPDTYEEVILDSLRLAGEEVFTRAQNDPKLNLATLFEGRLELSGEEVIKTACELFSVPFDQVERTGDFNRPFNIDPTAGYKLLRSVYVDNVNKEDADS